MLPRIGVVGELVTIIDGVAGLTKTETGEVAGRDAYVESPLYVAATVYVPSDGVEIIQLNKSVLGPLAGFVVDVQAVACPVTLQVTVPVGAAKPFTPVTSAAKVIA